MTRINERGDLVCPHCGANIITPLGHDVQVGIGLCGICKGEFQVSEEEAKLANERAGKEKS